MTSAHGQAELAKRITVNSTSFSLSGTSLSEYVEEQGDDIRNLVLHGQERNLGNLAIGKLNLLLHGLRAARLEPGDVIAEPGLADSQGRLLSYDRVIANPPFSMKNWGHEFAPGDPNHRFDRYGAIPAKTRGDPAFLLHMLQETRPSRHRAYSVVSPLSMR